MILFKEKWNQLKNINNKNKKSKINLIKLNLLYENLNNI